MITARSVSRKLKLRGIITNVATSATEVDDSNHPIVVRTTTAVKFLWWPAAGGESNDTEQIGKTNRVACMPSCTNISHTSTFTYAGVEFQVLDVQDWGVGMIVTLTRTV